jgi:hypothetical protein
MSYERPSPTQINLSQLVDKIYNELHNPGHMDVLGQDQQDNFLKNATGIHINDNYYYPIPSDGELKDLYKLIIDHFQTPTFDAGGGFTIPDPPTKEQIKTKICSTLSINCETARNIPGGMKKRIRSKSHRKKSSKGKSHRKKIKKRKSKTKRKKH